MKKLNNQKTGNFKKQHHNRKTNWHVNDKINKRVMLNIYENYF